MASCLPLFAQQSKIDSLQKIHPLVKSDNEKLFVVNELIKNFFAPLTLDTVKAKEFLIQLKELSIKLNDSRSKAFVQMREANLERQRKNNDAALQLLNDCKAFCERENLPNEKVEAVIAIGDMMQRKNKHAEAIASYMQALPEALQLKDTANLMNAVKGLGFSYYNLTAYDSSIKYYSVLKDYALPANHTPYGGHSCSMLAIMYQQRGDYEKGIELNKTAIEQYEQAGSKAQVANVLNNLANAYRFTGKHEDALQQYYRATAIREELKDSTQLASSIFNIADILKFTKQDRRAKEYYRRALDISIRTGDKKNQAISYGGIADVMRDEKQLDSALHYHKKALAIFAAIKDGSSIPQSHISIGQVYLKQRKYDEALTHFNMAKPLLNKEGFKQNLAILYNEMGNLYSGQDKLDDALKNYQLAYDIADSIGYLEGKRDFNRNLKDTYMKLGNYSKALQQAEVAAAIDDSLFRTEQVNSMQELTEKYESEKREQHIALLQKENELKTANELRSKQIRNFSFAGIVALVLILIFGTAYFIQRQKTASHRQELEKQKAVIDERDRIAGEMHDDLGAGLSTIKMMGEIAMTKPAGKDSSEMKQITQAAGELIDSMRGIVWSISSRNDTLEDLMLYIRKYAMEYCEAHGIECKMEMPSTIPQTKLSAEQRRNIFLVVKESLHNVLKHAHATAVEIKIAAQPDFVLSIRDNGTGYAAASVNRFGNGLKNMQRRMANIDGTFSIANKQGTTVTCRCELKLS